MAKMSAGKLNDTEFHTLLTMVEDLINQRPLAPLTDDPDDKCLRAVDFLRAAFEPAWAEEAPHQKPLTAARAWDRLLQVKRRFWEDYTTLVRPFREERGKWQEGGARPYLGQLVLCLQHPLHTDGRWPVGRIVHLDHDDPLQVRRVKVKVDGKVLPRDIRALAPLFPEPSVSPPAAEDNSQ